MLNNIWLIMASDTQTSVSFCTRTTNTRRLNLFEAQIKIPNTYLGCGYKVFFFFRNNDWITEKIDMDSLYQNGRKYHKCSRIYLPNLFDQAKKFWMFLEIRWCTYLPKYILRNLSLFFSCCPSKIIKSNIKPLINFTMKFIIFVTNLTWSQIFLDSFGLCRSSILVSATNVQSVIAS